MALLGALLAGCGVAGAPRPERPSPPKVVKVLCSPEGWWVHLDTERALVWLDGKPPVTAPGAVLRIPRQAGAPPPMLRLGGPDPVAPGAPGDPVPLPWTEPPAPPPPPLAFFGAGVVQITWLPPPAGTQTVLLLRDGHLVQRLPADAPGAQDAAARGPHQYTVRFEASQTLTAPSPPTAVTVP
ncbi:MAG: hypothetical protein H6702_07875 [Myxococcales bacterium]|nr:hypothetical protein [Myxococcales bacterium]